MDSFINVLQPSKKTSFVKVSLNIANNHVSIGKIDWSDSRIYCPENCFSLLSSKAPVPNLSIKEIIKRER